MNLKTKITLMAGLAIFALGAGYANAQNIDSPVPCSNSNVNCKVGPASTYAPNYGITSPKNAIAKPPKNTLKVGDQYTGEPGRRVYHSPAGQAIARGATTNKPNTAARQDRSYAYIFNEPDPEVIGNGAFTETPAPIQTPRYTKP